MKHGLFAEDQKQTGSHSGSYNPGIFTNLYSGRETGRSSTTTRNAPQNKSATVTGKASPAFSAASSKRNSMGTRSKSASGHQPPKARRSSTGSTPYTHTADRKRSTSVSGDSGWDGDNWLEATTKDGRIYFYHRKTRKVRWDKPPPHIARQMDERKKQEEMVAEKAPKWAAMHPNAGWGAKSRDE